MRLDPDDELGEAPTLNPNGPDPVPDVVLDTVAEHAASLRARFQADPYAVPERMLDGVPVQFRLFADTRPYLNRALQKARADDFQRVSEFYSKAFREAVDAAGGEGLALEPRPYGGPTTGGGGGGDLWIETIELLTLATTMVGGYLVWVKAADHVRLAIAALKRVTGGPVTVSDGCAVMLASEHLYERDGIADTRLAFVNMMWRPGPHEMAPSVHDGFLVGLRQENRLHLVHVSAAGVATSTTVDPLTIPVDSD